MTDIEIAEVLYLINRIEELMYRAGAKGESFSDKVKSFDKFEILYPDIDRSSMGYKFYYKNGTYHIKDQYDYDSDIEKELQKYIDFKTYRKRRSIYRKELINGQYHTLRIIGHERNQLMHIYDYRISNYRNFIKACREVISYFEKGQKSTYGRGVTILDKADDKIHTLTFQSAKKECKLASEIFLISLLVGLTILLFVSSLLFSSFVKDEIKSDDIPVTNTMYDILKIANKTEKINTADASTDDMKKQLKRLLKSNQSKNEALKKVGNKIDILQQQNSILEEKLRTTQRQLNERDQVSKHVPLVESRKPQSVNEECKYFYVKSKKLNVRYEANKSSRKVYTLKQKEKVCVTKKKSPWYFINNKGWVHRDYLSKTLEKVSKKKKHVRKKSDRSVWHCTAKSKRASGWVERVGKQNAKNGALKQCNMRRQTSTQCRITNCYQIR